MSRYLRHRQYADDDHDHGVLSMPINTDERKRGRPPGRSPTLTITLPARLLARIDTFAREEFMRRPAALRHLCELGLEAVGTPEREGDGR